MELRNRLCGLGSGFGIKNLAEVQIEGLIKTRRTEIFSSVLFI